MCIFEIHKLKRTHKNLGCHKKAPETPCLNTLHFSPCAPASKPYLGGPCSRRSWFGSQPRFSNSHSAHCYSTRNTNYKCKSKQLKEMRVLFNARILAWKAWGALSLTTLRSLPPKEKSRKGKSICFPFTKVDCQAKVSSWNPKNIKGAGSKYLVHQSYVYTWSEDCSEDRSHICPCPSQPHILLCPTLKNYRSSGNSE